MRLHKFVCNKKEFLDVIPESERTKTSKDVNLNYSDITKQSVLGVEWNVEADVMSFSVILKEKPAT